MENKLPKNWVKTELGKVTTEPQYGWTTKSQDVGVVKYLRTTDLSKGNINWDAVPYCVDVPEDINKYQIENDDILISRAGSIGLSFKIENPPRNTIFASYLIRFKPLINAIIIKYYLHTSEYWSEISNVAAGIAVQNVNAQKLKTLAFPLPPLLEQERIAAKLDILFAQLDIIRTSLDKIPQLLKDFRQQVLTQAVTGKLTEKWREDKELTSAQNLIDMIKDRRTELYRKRNEDYLAKGFKRPQKPILHIEIKHYFKTLIPSSWSICSIGDISDVCNGSTPSRQIQEYWSGDIPWISSGLVQNNKIYAANEYISELGFKNSSTRILPTGTILLAMIGEGKTRGQSAILEIKATINQNIAAIIIDHNLIVPEYLQYYLINNYDNNRKAGNGTGPQALNCQKVRELSFVLPPYLEQQKIVHQVESLFSKADKIKEKYQTFKQKVDTLPQAILHKAFKGELVKQLPTDGNASILLHEIEQLKKSLKKK